MRKLLSLVVVLALGTSLAACGSDDKKAADDFGKSGIKVTEEFGKKPTVTHREGEPDKALVTEVLKEGNGPEVKKGELMVAQYLGQIWRDGKVFDNSYDRGAPASFPIGVGRVVTGWDEGLVGKKAGSRVLLSIPPDKGYKEQGNPDAGIQGTDTLIFVVDIIGAFDLTKKPSGGTPATVPAGNPTVTGPLTAEAKVTVPKGYKAPAKNSVPIIITKGTGKPLEKNTMLETNYTIFDYTGKKQFSTFDPSQESPTPGPVAQPIAPTGAQNAGALANLVGVPLGSRILMHLPPQQGQAAFVVLDLIDSMPISPA
ncbi:MULTISPECIES: FKBP-type peptidyl-prolyl cis-trans isomerase [unclassified Kribbella]|uniref:FKBP-type peptidyl-prolyl cis-trans isomerase n=1 Tax=unclassified Kribbella TaxID=2644121 RepID=UPI003017FD3B